jgi:DNA repair protein RadC
MQKLMIKSGNRYRQASAAEVAEVHGAYQLQAVNRLRPALTNPRASVEFLRSILGGRDHEVFVVVFVDNRHRVIAVEEMFRGTIDGASVHPREVVKQALWTGAAAVLFSHNHPSGVAEPSQADELITRRLREALALIDVRVLDHIIVGLTSTCSFAERGLL